MANTNKFVVKNGLQTGGDIVSSANTLIANSTVVGALSGTNLTNLTAGNLTGTIPSGVLGNSTVFIGTTGVALNRASGALTLAGLTLTSPTLTTPTLGVATATSINKLAITAPATGSTLTIADGKTATINNTLTFTGTDASSVAFGAGGTVAYTSNKLSAFAATTSAELLGVISDETGSGSLVFATSPTIATPTVTGTATFSNDVTITGNLTVNGTTVTINSTTVSVDDKNLELGAVAVANNSTADGGGITLRAGTDVDKTILWDLANTNWTSSENFNVATGKTYKINNTNVLSATALGTGVVSSSLTSVGTLTGGTWNATTIGTAYGGTGLTTFTSGGAVYATSTSALTTGTLPATAGGTGQSSYAVGDLLYASTTSALSKLADVATGNALISGGVGVAPAWGKIGLTTHVSGTLAIANGGTGQTTATAAFNGLSPLTTLGDSIYHDGTNNVRLAGNITAVKQFLSQTGTGTVSAAPSWSAVTKADVGLSAVENTALSTWAGSANITTLGTVATGTWNATTIAVNKGGTGQTTYTDGQLLIGNTTGNTLTKATLTQGQNITITNGSGSIAIAAANTNLTWTAGTTAGPVINSSTGSGQAIPVASATASGVVTTAAQTFAGDKSFTGNTTFDTTTLVIDATNNKVLIGIASAVNMRNSSGGTIAPAFELHDNGIPGSTLSTVNWSSTQNGSYLVMGKSRGGSPGTRGLVNSGDDLGTIMFEGDDGTNFIPAASIRTEVDGVANTEIVSGKLVFSTTAAGANTATSRMAITSAGNVGIGTVSPTYTLQIVGNTSISSDTTLGANLAVTGTITSGTWNGAVVNSTYGGTGVNNGGRTLTIVTANVTFTSAAGGSSVTLPSTGTLATTSNKLSAFAATTSAELAGVISDETGSGSLVFGTAPALANPVVTGGSINNTPIGATTASTGNFSTLSIGGTAITSTAAQLNFANTVTSNIQTQLDAKAPLASPALTGTPTAPTATAGTNTTQVATTAFVTTAVSAGASGKANTSGDTFTGLVNFNAGLTANTISSVAGTAAAPSVYVRNANSGIYSASAGVLNIATNGALAATFDGTGNFIAVGDVTSNSDARLKENVITIDTALDKVTAMRGVYFNKIGKAERKIGLIAQEVEAIIPEVITEDADGIKSVAYANLVGLLIEALKDVKDELNSIKADINIIKAKE